MYSEGERTYQDDAKSQKAYKKAFGFFTKLASARRRERSILFGVMNQNKQGVSRNKKKPLSGMQKLLNKGTKGTIYFRDNVSKGIIHKWEWFGIIFGVLCFMPLLHCVSHA